LKILIAIDSLYSLSDSFINELVILSKDFEINFFLITTIGNKNNIEKIKQNKNFKKPVAFIEVQRIEGLTSLFKTFFKILYNFFNSQYIVLIGDNINPEERILIKTLSGKSKYIGILPTLPPITKDYISDNLQKKSYNLKYDFHVITKKILKLQFNFFKFFYFLGKKIILFLWSYKVDETAIKNGYLNINLANYHFLPNPFWGHIIKQQYPQSRILIYNDIELNKANQKPNNLTLGHECKLLLIGPNFEKSYDVIIKSILNLSKLFCIKTVDIRPHPRFKEISLKLSELINISGLKSGIVPCEENIIDQSQAYGIVLGYASSVFNTILNQNIYLIIDEHYNSIEFESKNLDVKKMVGSFYGFNIQYTFLSSDGIWFCHLPEKVFDDIKRSYSFSELFKNELFN
jgi:hypothetical protein